MEAQQNKLDFFQKLGYSKEEVCRVLDKLGQGASENDLLQELIQTGHRPQVPENRMQCVHTSPVAQTSSKALILPEQREILSAEGAGDPASNLRPIVIDGSNVAMSHGNKEVFSCLGIQLVVDWFKRRGHQYIKVFVPSWRKEPSRFDTPITDQHVLEKLEKQSILVYTPSRKMKGKRLVCYDDRYIVKLAYEQDGVIVSNDNFRDLQNENPEWKWFIEQRLLMYSFVNDKFMPPDDPLGRHGPSLNSFLSKKTVIPEPKWQLCPYGKKCTYGIKCKFYHPERLRWDHLSVADELRVKSKNVLPICKSEDEKMKTGTLENRSWNTSTSAVWGGGCQAGSKNSSTYNLAEFHTSSSKWEDNNRDSAGNWMNVSQGHHQALLQDQAKHMEAMSKQISALSISARTCSGNSPAGPGKYEDLVDEQHRDHYPNYSLPLSRHSLCLDCPCLQVCSFEGCCRKQVSAVQTLPTPSYLRWQDLKAQQSGQYHSVLSSAESVSYCEQGDVQYSGNLQAKSFDPSQPLISSSFRTVDYYNHEPQQGSIISPIYGEQQVSQQTLHFGLPLNVAHQAISSYDDSVDTRNSIPLVQRSGNLHKRSPSRKPW